MYTHPGKPLTVMIAYRQYITSFKRKANTDRLSQGKPIAKRITRALIHYRGYIQTYLAAKRLVVKGVSIRKILSERNYKTQPVLIIKNKHG